MKPYYLKEIVTYPSVHSKELKAMLATTRERSITFPDGSCGFIFGSSVFAPFYQTQDCVCKKDGKTIVLTFVKQHKYGVMEFRLPFNIPVEPLSFRRDKIHKDTFLFRVLDFVTLCRGFTMFETKGKLEIKKPDDFCPIFDRYGHLIGLCIGRFNNEFVCIPIQELL